MNEFGAWKQVRLGDTAVREANLPDGHLDCRAWEASPWSPDFTSKRSDGCKRCNGNSVTPRVPVVPSPLARQALRHTGRSGLKGLSLHRDLEGSLLAFCEAWPMETERYVHPGDRISFQGSCPKDSNLNFFHSEYSN